MSAESQQLVVDICHKLHSRGEALIPGTGLAIKQGDLVFVPPADVHLDRLETEDIFTFNCEFDAAGNPELNSEATNPCHNISAYTKLFLKLFQDFDCGCVFYAQPKSAVVIGELFEKFYKIKNNQLITQISNGETKEQYPWTHKLSVPIITNPHDQTSLFKVLEKAFEANPQTNAVIIKGNGLFVCGDTWQETKLMFETLLRLFEVSIELVLVGKSSSGKNIVASQTKKIAKKETSDIEIIEPKKASPILSSIKQRAIARQSEIRGRVGRGSTHFGRGGFTNRDDMALRRKKMALARLRVNDGGHNNGVSSGRMNAASFMQNNMTNQNVDNNYQQMPTITIGNGSAMNMGMGNGNNMNMDMNQMNSMNMNMNMNQGNNMMTNNQGNMPMNMGMGNGGMMEMGMNQGNMSMGMNQGNMSMGMNQGNMNMGMNRDLYNEAFSCGMNIGEMGNMHPGTNNQITEGRSSGLYRGLVRGQGYSRGNRSVSPRKRGGRGAGSGNVKERLGFKSTISVDPTELSNLEVNEEDY